jgi:hypothetical protein
VQSVVFDSIPRYTNLVRWKDSFSYPTTLNTAKKFHRPALTFRNKLFIIPRSRRHVLHLNPKTTADCYCLLYQCTRINSLMSCHPVRLTSLRMEADVSCTAPVCSYQPTKPNNTEDNNHGRQSNLSSHNKPVISRSTIYRLCNS